MRETIVALLLPLTFLACGSEEASAPDTSPKARATEAQGEKIDQAKAEQIQAKQQRATQKAGSAVPLTQLFRHSCGVYFFYPEGWKLQDNNNVLQLVPPDLKQGHELLLVVGEEAQGATRPDDPELIEYVSKMVQQAVPFLEAEGGMKMTTLKGKEVGALSWSGKSNEGTTYKGRMWISILNGYGVGLIAVSPADLFPGREAALREVFATLGFKKPNSDPRLIGRWRHEKVYSSGSFSTITVRNMILNSDGTCHEGGKLAASMSHSDSDGSFSGSSSGQSGGSGYRYHGRWRTTGKTIFMDWGNDGTEEWDYIISEDSLLLKAGKTRKLWSKKG